MHNFAKMLDLIAIWWYIISSEIWAKLNYAEFCSLLLRKERFAYNSKSGIRFGQIHKTKALWTSYGRRASRISYGGRKLRRKKSARYAL